jgi:hypothetical protein
MDYEGEDFWNLVKTARKGDHTATGRRRRELKGVPGNDRRAMRVQAPRNIQLNMRVSAELKGLVDKLAMTHKVSTPDLIEMAVRAFAEAEAHAR